VSGAVNDTGIGGLTLGGGKGFLSGMQGLALDILLDTEVVLANGEIVRANLETNSDLFWALRGISPTISTNI
jgi:FAD/FMN-containing dehydrogenase